MRWGKQWGKQIDVSAKKRLCRRSAQGRHWITVDRAIYSTHEPRLIFSAKFLTYHWRYHV